MWRKVNPPTLLVVQPLWKTLWRFLKKLGINLLYDPAIPLLDIYPEKTNQKRHLYPNIHSSIVCIFTCMFLYSVCTSRLRFPEHKSEYYASCAQNISLIVKARSDLLHMSLFTTLTPSTSLSFVQTILFTLACCIKHKPRA